MQADVENRMAHSFYFRLDLILQRLEIVQHYMCLII
jgi:hypothetical protein